jgi:serine/threonine protein kinase
VLILLFIARQTQIRNLAHFIFKVAAKIVNKDKLKDNGDRAHVTRSVQLLQSLDHENVCKVAWITETANKVYVFLEYTEGMFSLIFIVLFTPWHFI